MQPLVGIEMQYEEGRGFFLMPGYAELLEAAGARVELVRPDRPVDFSRFDGFVIPGGDDIDARLYGQEPLPGADAPIVARDSFEPEALAFILHKGIPYLGICRGMQMLDVACGGTLDQRLETPGHWREPGSAPAHDIRISPDGLLAHIAGTGDAQVNSLHRQGIAHLGANLRVEATAPDGVVEAISLPGRPFALGVQWHPELMPADPLSQAIAHAFVRAARAPQKRDVCRE